MTWISIEKTAAMLILRMRFSFTKLCVEFIGLRCSDILFLRKSDVVCLLSCLTEEDISMPPLPLLVTSRLVNLSLLICLDVCTVDSVQIIPLYTVTSRDTHICLL